MRKTILMFILLVSTTNTMAQAYEFKTEEKSLNDGVKYVDCETKDFTKLNVTSPDIQLEMWDYYGEDKMPVVSFFLYKDARGQHKNSFAVAKKIRDMALSITAENDWEKINLTINMYLSNGDVLRGTNKGWISTGRLQNITMSIADSLGYVSTCIPISLLESSLTPVQIQTKENQQLICQQLRTYDIVKIDVDGVSFDVRGLRSAATFDAMFDALAAKTGKGHLYRSSGTSSSSSSVSSGPSATCELGYIAVFSNGAIRCRVDNLQISGAKGKKVEINAIFENTASDDVAEGFVKKITDIPYDDCTYETLSVKGEADDLIRLMRNYRGRFKVHLEVDIGNRCVYTSNSTYITIYNEGGRWRRN